MTNEKDTSAEPPPNTTSKTRTSDTEAILAAIVESSDDAIISKDLNGVITSWNRGAENIFGYAAEEVIGKPITILIPKDRLGEEPSILERIRKGEKIDHFETVRQRKDGTLVDISLTVSPIRNSEGKIIGASKIARDISERKVARRHMARLVAIVESSDDAIVSKDLEGIITSWNKGAENLFGYSAKEAIGRSVTMLIPRDRIDEEPEILSKVSSGAKIEHYETIRKRKDGRLINISLGVSPIFDSNGKVVGASKIARDISNLLTAESDRRDKQMLQRLVDAEESERRRIARDLHDHLGQKMTGLRLKMENLFQNIDPERPDIAEMISAIREVSFAIDENINYLAWELRPTELEELGIEAALSSFVSEWSTHYDIRAEFNSNVGIKTEERARPDIETNLYRFLQEALNNVHKHAAASFVSVMYVHYDGEIVLAVEDDGRGFDPEVIAPPAKMRRLGLTGMRERISLLNGTLDIETAPGEGTKLLARVPFVAAAHQNENDAGGDGVHLKEPQDDGP